MWSITSYRSTDKQLKSSIADRDKKIFELGGILDQHRKYIADVQKDLFKMSVIKKGSLTTDELTEANAEVDYFNGRAKLNDVWFKKGFMSEKWTIERKELK
jgi:hypothetical protein